MSQSMPNIEEVCKNLYALFQDVLSWEWDDRFEAVLAKCCSENHGDVQKAVADHLKNIWDSSGTQTPPDNVLNVIGHFGGLMPGQLLFTSDPSKQFLLCCAWWPWKDGETISVRIAPPSQQGLSKAEKDELINRFKSWFGIEQHPAPL